MPAQRRRHLERLSRSGQEPPAVREPPTIRTSSRRTRSSAAGRA